MTDLTEFLLARIAEDEQRARAAYPSSWYATGDTVEANDDDEPPNTIVCTVEDEPVAARAEYIAHSDPARVLAECEAKRRIVEAYERNRDRIEANVSDHTKASARGELSALPTLRSAGWDLGGRDWALEMTLRLLALPYADHPDYLQEWRP